MKQLVFNGKCLENIVQRTENIVIQRTQEGRSRKKCYIIGNGHSLSVDENNVVKKHDPFMHKFEPQVNEDVTVYVFYFTFECLGLYESGKDIAKFVNNLTEDYDQIVLIGHSKCGLCLYSADLCIPNITLVTISTPFEGTVVADKKSVEKMLKLWVLRKIYDIGFSDHNVDRDIMPASIFIQNTLKPHYQNHINITSSLKSLRDCRDIMDVLLLIVDRIMKIDGDGIVPIKSQNVKSTKTIHIKTSHSNSLKIGLGIVEKM